jgi:AcrR family transcriptional regulator
LSRERVLEAAIRLADEGGIESLTMRKLARELSVEAMSLYNHVANKGDLVDAMVEVVVGEIELPDAPRGDWETAIRRAAISAHDVFLRHRWACGLAMSGTTGQTARTARLRYMEWLLGLLRGAGFSADLTYRAYHALDSHILGFTLWQIGHTPNAEMLDGRDVADLAAAFLREFPAADFPHVAEHIEQHIAPPGDGENDFEFTLSLVLDGLKRAREAE